MNNDIDLSDMLGPNNARHSMPPRDDRSPDDNAEDSATPLRCDNSSTNQDFLSGQRDKLLKLIQSRPQELERIQDLYRTHLAGQFHIVARGEWDRFWSLIDGLHSLGPSFQAGSILLGGWKEKRSDLQPPTSLSDQVSDFSRLPDDFYNNLQLLNVYGEAARLRREFTIACDTNDKAGCRRAGDLFSALVEENYQIFRPVVFNDTIERVPSSPVTMSEFDGLAGAGRLDDIQDKVAGWIYQHSHIKAFHFLPAANPSSGWREFHWFCHTFNFLKPISKNGLCFYFLIQLPVE